MGDNVVMQMEALECGAASLTMILAYYDKWIPLEQVRADGCLHYSLAELKCGSIRKSVKGGKTDDSDTQSQKRISEYYAASECERRNKKRRCYLDYRTLRHRKKYFASLY